MKEFQSVPEGWRPMTQHKCHEAESKNSFSCVLSQSRLTLRPCGLQPPGSSVYGIMPGEYWSGLPCPPPGDLPDPGIKSMSPAIPALSGGFFTTEPPCFPGGSAVKNSPMTRKLNVNFQGLQASCYLEPNGHPFPFSFISQLHLRLLSYF